jgi:hypothetical protein
VKVSRDFRPAPPLALRASAAVLYPDAKSNTPYAPDVLLQPALKHWKPISNSSLRGISYTSDRNPIIDISFHVQFVIPSITPQDRRNDGLIWTVDDHKSQLLKTWKDRKICAKLERVCTALAEVSLGHIPCDGALDVLDVQYTWQCTTYFAFTTSSDQQLTLALGFRLHYDPATCYRNQAPLIAV